MKENLNISEFDHIFRQKLVNANATPPAGVWEGIASSLSAPAAITTATIVTKTALWFKIGIGVIVASVASTSIYYINQRNTAPAITDKKVVSAPLEEIGKPVTTFPETTTKPNEESVVYQSETVPERKDVQAPVPVTEPVKNNIYSPEVIEFKADILELKTTPPQEKSIEVIQDEMKKEQIEIPYEPKNESFSKKIDSSFIFIPDVVTPNGDGLNDSYLIDIKGEESVRIIIFTISQNKLFETTNKYQPWNCVMPNGDLYPQGTYVVKVIYKFPGLPEKTKTISLKLIR